MALPPLRIPLPSALLRALLLPGLLAIGTAQGAEPAAPSRPAGPPLSAPEAIRNEPVVQHIVIDDQDTRIEELHVRGEAKRITVKPKGAPRLEYEVIPAGGERNMAPGPGSSRGAAGQRVWNVLNF